jgi:hypothetical protein
LRRSQRKQRRAGSPGSTGIISAAVSPQAVGPHPRAASANDTRSVLPAGRPGSNSRLAALILRSAMLRGPAVAKSRITKIRLRPRETAPATLPQPLATGTRPTRTAQVRGPSGHLRPSDPEFWTVINEVADPTPIAPAELDAIERYFSAVLDDVFAPSRKTSP